MKAKIHVLLNKGMLKIHFDIIKKYIYNVKKNNYGGILHDDCRTDKSIVCKV